MAGRVRRWTALLAARLDWLRQGTCCFGSLSYSQVPGLRPSARNCSRGLHAQRWAASVATRPADSTPCPWSHWQPAVGIGVWFIPQGRMAGRLGTPPPGGCRWHVSAIDLGSGCSFGDVRHVIMSPNAFVCISIKFNEMSFSTFHPCCSDLSRDPPYI